jgi:hypothetical protein
MLCEDAPMETFFNPLPSADPAPDVPQSWHLVAGFNPIFILQAESKHWIRLPSEHEAAQAEKKSADTKHIATINNFIFFFISLYLPIVSKNASYGKEKNKNTIKSIVFCLDRQKLFMLEFIHKRDFLYEICQSFIIRVHFCPIGFVCGG